MRAHHIPRWLVGAGMEKGWLTNRTNSKEDLFNGPDRPNQSWPSWKIRWLKQGQPLVSWLKCLFTRWWWARDNLQRLITWNHQRWRVARALKPHRASSRAQAFRLWLSKGMMLSLRRCGIQCSKRQTLFRKQLMHEMDLLQIDRDCYSLKSIVDPCRSGCEILVSFLWCYFICLHLGSDRHRIMIHDRCLNIWPYYAILILQQVASNTFIQSFDVRVFIVVAVKICRSIILQDGNIFST